MHDYLLALIGGILIAISSSIMLGGIGKVTGISGILGGTLSKITCDNIPRYGFLLGLIIGGALLLHFKPNLFQYSLQAPLPRILCAGLLVGFGTRLGSGCTSGHGVCGIPRLSKRSTLATMTFIFFGVLTVAIEGLLA